MRRLSLILIMLCTVGALAQETSEDLQSALRSASPGDVVELGFSSLPLSTVLNDAPNQIPAAGAGLIYSDDPETAEEEGILYQDTLSRGHHRIYAYHVNGTDSLMHIAVILENTSDADIGLIVESPITPTPSTDYVGVGREASHLFNQRIPLASLAVIKAGESLSVISDPVGRDHLVHFIWDFFTDVPLQATVLMCDASDEPEQVVASLPFATDDGFNREGTFPFSLYENHTPLAFDTADGIRRISIANRFIPNGNAELTGTDAQTGERALLRGNYGVEYIVRVEMSDTNARAVALLLNPRGGAYGGHFETEFPETVKEYGVDGASVRGVMVPSDSLSVESNTQGGLIGTYQPTDTPQTLLIKFMPAAASSMPIDLLLVPYDSAPVGLVSE